MVIADVKAAEYLFEASRVATERYGPAALPRRRGPPGTPKWSGFSRQAASGARAALGRQGGLGRRQSAVRGTRRSPMVL
jgi:hypothetical protein